MIWSSSKIWTTMYFFKTNGGGLPSITLLFLVIQHKKRFGGWITENPVKPIGFLYLLSGDHRIKTALGRDLW